jgi:hypothetical protein
MAYSTVGIVNIALQKIGVMRIAALGESSEQAIAANAVWQYIRDEVLQAKEWTFAKVKVALAQNATSPSQGYEYAYTLPADFLRMDRDDKDDPAVYPSGYNYAIETLADRTLCLFTDYDNSSENLYIRYIRRITDPQKFTPMFISALAFRLAAELAIPRTEGLKKYKAMMEMYSQALIMADGINQSGDYQKDEIGSDDWERVGR